MKGAVRKRGATWSYYFTYNKKRIEKGGFGKKRLAEKALREALDDIETHGLINEVVHTLAELADYFFENVAPYKLKDSTFYNYKKCYEKHIEKELGGYGLRELTPALLQRFFDTKNKVLMRASMKPIKSILNNLFKAAYKQELIKENPLLKVELNGRKSERRELVGAEDLARLEKSLQGTQYHIAFQIGYYTGARVGEILGLTWDKIDFAKKKIKIEQNLQLIGNDLVLTTVKTESSRRVVALPDDLAVLLKKTIDLQKYRHSYSPTAYVCQNKKGSPFRRTALTWGICSHAKKLDFDFNFHQLRHFHATWLLEVGAPVKAVQKHLGHSRVDVTLNIYAHATAAMDAQLEKHLNEICHYGGKTVANEWQGVPECAGINTSRQ